MKRIFLASAVLLLFAVSVSIFQISCEQDATADTDVNNDVNNNLTQLNKIIYVKGVYVTEGVWNTEIWLSNYDGTGSVKVNISLPTGIYFSQTTDVSLSPDGKKIFFTAGPKSGNEHVTANFTYTGDLYSCNVDGSNVTKIIDRGGAKNTISGVGAY